MIRIPENIDYRATANAAAARARRAPPVSATSVGYDVSVALFSIGKFDELSSNAELAELEDENTAAPLIAAARTLISASEELRQSNPSSLEIVDSLLIHAAVAFGMHGNFASARTSMLDVSYIYRTSTSSRRLAWAVCDPAAIEQIIDIAGDTPEEVQFYRAWKQSLQQASVDYSSTAEILLQSFVVSPSVSDTALLLSTEVAFRQAFRLAISHLRSVKHQIPAAFIDRLLESGRWTLLPPQRKLLAEKLLAQSHGNTLLNLPTSTGKTLLAEACLAVSTADGGVAVYVAPFVAIGEQVLTALRSHMPEDVKVISMFGGFKNEFPQTDSATKQVVVATPERLDGWLRSGGNIDNLRTIIFDELHSIENDSRGARLEGLITRLRLKQEGGSNFRLVGLSAVLPDAQSLRAWLSIKDEEFHKEGWRPTARRLAICRSDGTMFWIHGADALRPTNQQFGTSTTQAIKLSLPEVVRPSRGEFVADKTAIAQCRNIAAIAKDLSIRLRGPGLIVCSRRVDTRRLAAALAITTDAASHSAERLNKLSEKIAAQFPWLNGLSESVKSGVAYHNSTLPFEVRRWIEQALRDGDISFIASTTTLAEGADLPFRWTLVSHWLRGIYANAPPMNPLTFRNIAGRSGRAGSFTEGDTILFESLLGPTNPLLSNAAARVQAIRWIFTDNSPLESAVKQVYEETGGRNAQSVSAAYESQLLAAIAENPDSDNIAMQVTKFSYAGATGKQQQIFDLFDNSLKEMLDHSASGGALATMNSPVRLTELGVAANRSGFSPRSVRQIVSFLANEDLPTEAAAVVASALAYFSQLPEQTNHYLIKTCTGGRHKQFLKAEDLEFVVASWFANLSVREIFEALPSFLKTKSSVETIETQFDNFVSFVDSAIRSYAPWLVRAMSALQEFGGQRAKEIDWSAIAILLEQRETAKE